AIYIHGCSIQLRFDLRSNSKPDRYVGGCRQSHYQPIAGRLNFKLEADKSAQIDLASSEMALEEVIRLVIKRENVVMKRLAVINAKVTSIDMDEASVWSDDSGTEQELGEGGAGLQVLKMVQVFRREEDAKGDNVYLSFWKGYVLLIVKVASQGSPHRSSGYNVLIGFGQLHKRLFGLVLVTSLSPCTLRALPTLFARVA
ncbi:hypothetical protein IFM89_019519, partial [Coptis chinensis]